MNAYELANELEINAEFPLDDRHRGADMLRQQADRIAELEKAYAELHHKALELGLKNPNKQTSVEPVAWFDGKYYVCPELGYENTITTEHPKDLGWFPLYTTPQTKSLTHEEIQKLWNPMPDTKVYVRDLINFARAIESKIRGME